MYSLSPYLGVLIFALVVFFYLRNRRKDRFDGNFDHAHVKGGGSGTTFKIDLEDHRVMGDNEEKVDEDDGMGGRLGGGPEGGGVITPYPFQPAPVGGTAVSGQQPQHQPKIRQISNAALVADGSVC